MRKIHAAQIFFSGLFILIISIPLFFKIFHIGPEQLSIMENRKLTEWPNLSKSNMLQWSRLLDSYFKDQLVYRGQLLSTYIRLWEGCLQAPVKRYVSGDKGELFLHYVSPTVFPSLGMMPLSKIHIAHMKLSYAGMQAYFKLLGIDYIIILIPDKSTLYSELLPFWSKWKNKEGNYQQMISAFSTTSINVLNMMKVMEKDKSQKFYNTRYDVEHWNGKGLKIAYETITKVLSSKYKDFVTKEEGVYYALRPQLQAFEGYEEERVPFMDILHQENFTIDTNENFQIHKQWNAPQVLTNKTDSQLTLLLAADSYFMATHTLPSSQWLGSISPLAHHVKTYVHMHYANLTIEFCEEIFKKYRPNIVIEAFVERMSGNVARVSDAKIRVLGDALLQTPGYILTSSSMQNGHFVNAFGRNEGSVFVLSAQSGDPMIIFQPLYTDTEGRAMVMAMLDSPADTFAQLFYAHEKFGFTETKSVKYAIKKGKNLVHMEIFDKPNEKIWMRFDPGAIAGEYRFLPLPEVHQIRGGSHGL